MGPDLLAQWESLCEDDDPFCCGFIRRMYPSDSIEESANYIRYVLKKDSYSRVFTLESGEEWQGIKGPAVILGDEEDIEAVLFL